MRARLPGLLALFAAFGLAAAESHAAADEVHKVLYITHSAGYRHEVLPLSMKILEDLGAKAGWFEVTATEDVAGLTADNLE